MKAIRWQALALAALLPISAAACSKVEASESTYEDPATVEEIDGASVVTLTPRAIERIGIETVPLAEGVGGKTVPYSAVLYDPDGSTWVYTQGDPGTFRRAPITVVDIRGDEVVVSDGPDAGTAVVSIGASELFGAEKGLGAH